MTQKQKKFLEELPKQNYCVMKAAKKAGYTDNSARKNIYTYIRKARNFKEYFSEEQFYKKLKKLEKEIDATTDFTNRLRLIELKSKILGLQIDKSENKTQIAYSDEERTELDRLRVFVN